MARILIIDDDPDIVDGLRLILESAHHEVVTKGDTANLLQEVARIDPDLVILDVIFPGDPQAGFKAARALARDPALRHIPVLMLSAVNTQSDLAFGFSERDISEDFMPVAAFLDKPVTPQALLAQVERLLRPAAR